jgi:hypothetical protein
MYKRTCRNIIMLLVIQIPALITVAQTTPRPIRPVVLPLYRQKRFEETINITDINGRPFQNVNEDVEGSPYFIDDFMYANITSSKGTVYENLKTKIDLYSNEVHLIGADHKQIIAQDGLIKDILLIDSSTGTAYQFRTGFPSIDKNTENSIYRVLSDGAVQLLKFSKKEISEAKDVMSGEVKKEFVQRDDYYVFQNGEIKKLKKDKDFILALMQDEKDKIDGYLKDKKMNFKNIEAIILLFTYYNSLLPRGF